jgi:DNA-damage-inducible protein J
MSETENLTIELAPVIKSDAEALYAELGMTLAQAVKIFIHQSVAMWAMPFQPKAPRPNFETLKALAEGDLIASGEIPAKSYASLSDMLADMNDGGGADDADA